VGDKQEFNFSLPTTSTNCDKIYKNAIKLPDSAIVKKEEFIVSVNELIVINKNI